MKDGSCHSEHVWPKPAIRDLRNAAHRKVGPPSPRGTDFYRYLRLDTAGAHGGNIALSVGERVSGDGAFSSRHRTGEGFLPFANHLVRPKLRISYSLPLPVRPAPCGATKQKLKTPHRPRGATGRWRQRFAPVSSAKPGCGVP